MKTLVVFAHPAPESYNASILKVVSDELAAKSFELQTLDLYQHGFEPRMSTAERRTYMDRDSNTSAIEKYVQQLQWAEALIMIYPTWWMGPPAILKGWLDRVWLPSVVADFGPNGMEPKLTNLKKILIITTQGASRWRMALIGNPPRKMMRLSLKAVTKCSAIDWLALYSMDKLSKFQLSQFLDKVRQKIKQF
ncbi:NAD(P)H-dependent oxidoreductase [Endozoicomonas sp. SCSIO W0465]|uniref:NAD(P)H-dependent oxidoreductase n=1 Tax=Endozoicomonas sp. SCSIO W0465 TaxID=2918516 RepID=UPI002074C72D|nr:NAD(P)H-dependent oxidoreductase [Endozoicomonas sp. SCSIO W0465]USE38522.1 NAD(P)H-dependent oxidoreductase [Endozoicomonas sp. SCSIO W0465]